LQNHTIYNIQEYWTLYSYEKDETKQLLHRRADVRRQSQRVVVTTLSILDSKQEWTTVGLICQEQEDLPVYLQKSSPNRDDPPENPCSTEFCILSAAQSKVNKVWCEKNPPCFVNCLEHK
jgi:hypothetical protein